MSPTDSASIIIPFSRDNETLQRCFWSLLSLDTPPAEVLIAGERRPEQLPEGLNIIFIKCTEKSPSIKRNIAARNAKGNIYCFIDDDVQVPPNWLDDIISILKKNPNEIIGGPNRDFRKDFSFRYPSAIQANFITEGLLSHKKTDSEKRLVGIHDLPLCNVAMKREVYDKIGGFNEDIPYFLDDVEFNYIAKKSGLGLALYDRLEVQHDIRPSYLPYFKYKFLTRMEIGKIMPVYGCLYSDSLQIRLVMASYLLMPLLLFMDYRVFASLAAVYLFILCVSAWPFRKDIPVFLLLPPGVFITQCLMYTGFTAGLFRGCLNYRKLKKLIPQRDKRFGKIKGCILNQET